jgi:hypothetical protein
MRGYRTQPTGEIGHKRTSVCSLICRANSPQPYPYFHSRQNKPQKTDNLGNNATIGNSNQIADRNSGGLLRSPQYSPILSSSPASASSASPQAVVVENGRQFFVGTETEKGSSPGNNPLTSLFTATKKDGQNAHERIPLVIKYNPNKGATTTKGKTPNSAAITTTNSQIPLIARSSQMGKSYSIDAPVSIAHV